ncbi:MAG: GH3 auxin-responsive promoter family protein, partial [Leptospiraceae bacterium]|nr:GH3 auxin-responsive promoter family protein [Leptospiraceae bacterium]
VEFTALEKDTPYEVILTTGGGLYRYATGDLVLLTGYYYNNPCLRFIGRHNHSDLAGEKLSENLVTRALNALIQTARARGLQIPGAWMAARLKPKVGYAIHLEIDSQANSNSRHDAEAQTASLHIDAETLQACLAAALRVLETNPYFREALLMGQLAPVELIIAKPGCLARIQKRIQAEGRMADGDFKPPVLLPVDHIAADVS